MPTEDLPQAEYDKPGWLAHLVLGLFVLAWAVWQLIDPVKSGPGRWLLPLGWLVIAGYYAMRSRRLWLNYKAREAARHRWEDSRVRSAAPTTSEIAPSVDQ